MASPPPNRFGRRQPRGRGSARQTLPPGEVLQVDLPPAAIDQWSSRLTGGGSWTAVLKEVLADSSFLRSRKMTWTCVLWSGYIATWQVFTGSGLAIVAFWWLVGVVVFGLLWLALDRKPFARAR